METCTGPGSFTRAAGGQGFGRPSWAGVAWGAAGSPGCRRSWGRRGLGLGRSRLGGARDGTHRLPRTGQGLARGYAAGVPAGQSPPRRGVAVPGWGRPGWGRGRRPAESCRRGSPRGAGRGAGEGGCPGRVSAPLCHLCPLLRLQSPHLAALLKYAADTSSPKVDRA